MGEKKRGEAGVRRQAGSVERERIRGSVLEDA